MRAYVTVLRTPGALAFCAAGLLARFGGAMVGIGTVLMVSSLYGSYGLAGGLAAANAVAWAIGTAILSHLVDLHGQRRIMLPAALISAGALAVMVVLAFFHAPVITLFVLTAISGFTGGSPGSMVRARWNYVLDSSRDLHTAFSLESTLDELCFVAGPVLATWFATTVHPTAGLVGPVVFGIGGALVFYSLVATQPPVIPPDPAEKGPSRLVVLYPGMAPVVGVGLLMGCMFGSLDVTIVAAMTAWDARSQAGLVLGVMSFGSALGGLLYGARGWTSALWKRFTVGVALLGFTVAFLYFATSPLVLAGFGFIMGMTVAPTFINANGLIGRLVPPNRLTEGLAWLGTAIGIGVSLGSTVAGQVIDVAGHRGGLYCGIASGLLACLLGVATAPLLKRITGQEAVAGASPTE